MEHQRTKPERLAPSERLLLEQLKRIESAVYRARAVATSCKAADVNERMDAVYQLKAEMFDMRNALVTAEEAAGVVTQDSE